MSFSMRGPVGSANFRPNMSRNVRRGAEKGRFGLEGGQTTTSAKASAAAGTGLPTWCYPALLYCAAVPIYTQVNSKKMIEEGWARHYAQEAAAGGHSSSAPKADLVLVETIKNNAVGVPERVMVLIPSDSMLAAERERKWVKPTVRTAVGLGVGAAVIGTAAYFDKKQKDRKLVK